jgi:acyl-coenzyme A thioesterase PaaI-like protein
LFFLNRSFHPNTCGAKWLFFKQNLLKNMTTSAALKLWKQLETKPFGKRIFSFVISRKAPYFATIASRFEALGPGLCRASMKKRRRVHNHIGTVHAIAVCNLAELVAGLCTDVSVPAGVRWLPKSMNVEYLAKATTDLMGECTLAPIEWCEGEKARDVIADVRVTDTAGLLVCRARITMYLTRKEKIGAGKSEHPKETSV